MKDNELRGVALKYFYDRRAESKVFIGQTHPPIAPMDTVETFRICEQLSEKGLITWVYTGRPGRYQIAHGKITGAGSDLVEGSTTNPAVVIHHVDQSISVSGVSSSAPMVIGHHNTVTNIEKQIQEIIRAVQEAPAPPEQKAEALSRLKEFIAHPLVTSIAGAATGLLGAAGLMS